MKLKNYEKYYQSILTYCSAVNIKVKISDYADEGRYFAFNRTIFLDESLSEADDISTLLHELGHAFDFDDRFPPRLNEALHAMDQERITKKQKDLVLKHENRAWYYAVIIAKSLKIPLGKWFYKDRHIALNSYRSLR